MKHYLLSYFVLALSLALTAQNDSKNKIIANIDTEAAYGIGGGAYGIFIKANHVWIKKKKLSLLSGLSTGFFFKKDKLESSIYTRNGISDDVHLNFHSGINYSFLKSNKIYLNFELYLGYYFLRNKGEYESANIVFSTNAYKVYDYIFDWGTRLGIGYNLNEKTSIQLSMTNSFNQFEIFSGSAYSKIYYGLGINYQFE